VSFFEQIKPSLKTKWLDYYENNHEWMQLLMDGGEFVETPDGGRRPQGSVVIGAVSSMEPRLAEILYHFFLVHANYDTVVDVVGLNFDPTKELSSLQSSGAAAKPVVAPPPKVPAPAPAE
jgi:hypothetical protein